MIPVNFKESNVVLTATDCENIRGLNDGFQILTKWKGSLLDRIRFLLFGTIWLCVKGQRFAPVWIKTKVKFVKNY